MIKFSQLLKEYIELSMNNQNLYLWGHRMDELETEMDEFLESSVDTRHAAIKQISEG